MLQVLQNGLQSTKTSIADNAMLERNTDEQFLVSFEEVFIATEIEEKTEKSDISMADTNEEIEMNEYSDVMQVREVEKKNDLETTQDVVINNKDNNKKGAEDMGGTNKQSSQSSNDQRNKLVAMIDELLGNPTTTTDTTNTSNTSTSSSLLW